MILVLIPTKPNISSSLRAASDLASNRLADELHSFVKVVRDSRGSGDRHVNSLAQRVQHTAKIRQAIVDDYLTDDYSHVFWIDADVIDYSPGIVHSLYRASLDYNAIVAPLVLLQNHGERFYDIAGFIEYGRWANLHPPYFKQTRRFINMDSVGCFYIVPAEIYRRGAKHIFHPAYPTDHMAICQFGKRLGYRVVCDTKLAVYHANLPDYGENAH